MFRYTSTARVVLLGTGADETLGGYTRYRAAFDHNSSSPFQALAEEMEKDFNRLWRRNLGRDDHVVSDTGKEVIHMQ